MIAEHVAAWTRCQKIQLQICELLGRIGERLPIHDIGACNEVAKLLTTQLTDIHSYEEKTLFPILRSISSQIAALLENFHTHHAHDRTEAEKIAESISLLVYGEAFEVAELKTRISLFVEGLRRHVQFEDAICRALFASKRAAAAQAVQ